MFDVAAVGSIKVSNLKKIARELGISVKEEELEEMIKRADVDGDGEVSEKEFIDKIDVLNTTPMEALNLLFKIKEINKK